MTGFGRRVLWSRRELTSVTIPNGVTTIQESAFRSCSNMTSITIPASIAKIGNMAFYFCHSLKDVYYGGSNFFQLRELGAILGFEVDYDVSTNTAIIRSTQK